MVVDADGYHDIFTSIIQVQAEFLNGRRVWKLGVSGGHRDRSVEFRVRYLLRDGGATHHARLQQHAV